MYLSMTVKFCCKDISNISVQLYFTYCEIKICYESHLSRLAQNHPQKPLRIILMNLAYYTIHKIAFFSKKRFYNKKVNEVQTASFLLNYVDDQLLI